MSSLFEDKKYESLDWISQAVEPYEFTLNAFLTTMPDEFVFTFDTYVEHCNYGASLSISSVIASMMAKAGRSCNYNYSGSWSEMKALENCYAIEMSEDAQIDFETKTLTGMVKVVKVKSVLEEKEIVKLIAAEVSSRLSRMRCEEGKSRLHDIAEILEKGDDVFRTRPFHKKRYALAKRFQDIIQNDEWRIRSDQLAYKIAGWIVSYVENGNLAAYANFCKVKVMTHKGLSIYSVKEEV